MNILTDILSLFKRKKFITNVKADDVIVIGINEEPEIEGIASPVPYKDVKLIKYSDFLESTACENVNVPLLDPSSAVFRNLSVDPVTGDCFNNFRRLKSISLNLTINENGDFIEFDNLAEANTASNIGGGSEVFKQKVGEDFEFRTLTSLDASVIITEGVDTIDLSVISAGGETLAETLALGNTTGVNDISIDSGQTVIYNNGLFATTFGTTTLTGNQSIVLPDASGTVALTSDLGAYLPLAGGTMVGDIELGNNKITNGLGSVNLTVNGFGHTDGTDTIGMNSTNGQFSWFDGGGLIDSRINVKTITAPRTWTMPDASGIVMVGPAFDALIATPTIAEDGKVIAWNDTNQEYELVAGVVGTVTSIDATIGGTAITTSGVPITTSGTIAFTYNGTAADYIDGAGDVQSFPAIPVLPANIVETVTTTDGSFINLTPNAPIDGAVAVTADLSATGTPDATTFLRGDNTWVTPPVGIGDLISTNNLSDVDNAVTSLSNLGGEPSFAKNTAFNKDFGTIAGTVLEGDKNADIVLNTAKVGITPSQAINITINNAKITNATHTGDVTGSTVLTIAAGAVDIPMLSATGTADATTFLRGDNTWATPGGMSTGTTVSMLASSPAVGNQWYNTDDFKIWVYSDKLLWFVPGETMIVNKQSGTFEVGELVIPDSTLITGVEIATTPSTTEIVGVNVWQVNTELFCVVAYGGIWDVLCADDSSPYSVGDFLVHDGSGGEDGQAKRRTTGNGHMAICMEAGTASTGGSLLKCQIQTTERY